MKKVAVIDGQVFQSAAWDRGMGKYSLCLLSALCASDKYNYDETHIVFTDKLALSEAAKKSIKNAAPGAKFTVLELAVPNIHDHDSIQPIMNRNKAILDKFITQVRDGQQDTKVDFLILSLFIDQICSVYPADCRNILLFYDLIPLQYSDRYGRFHNYSNYLRRFSVIMDATAIWTISQTVADDLLVYMGIDPSKICNINGAPIARDHQISSKPSNMEVPRRFLLMPSGNDLRKNNDRAVLAVSEHNRTNINKISLVVTSFFDKVTMDHLKLLSDDVVFTGNVSEGELKWLYENALALLFVPEYEGLGLPVLEAVEADIPVVCSNLTVFDEMSTSAFYYSNQFDPVSIANAISDALERRGWSRKRKEYGPILRRYTWGQTAKDALEFLERKGDKVIGSTKPRIAFFTPNPSAYSAIGKFNLHLHPSLSEYFEIDYYVEDGVSGRTSVRPSYLSSVSKTFSSRDFNAKRYEDYDAVLYSIGNSEFHLDTIKNALHLPGYAIFHDTNLKGIFFQDFYDRGYIDKARLDAEQLLDDMLKTTEASYIGSIVNNQLGIVAHSEHNRLAIKNIAQKDTLLIHADLPVATPMMKKRNLDGHFSIGFAGIIHPAKGLVLLDMIVGSGILEDAHIYLFGIPLIPDYELRRIQSLNNVTVLTNLTDFEFQSKLAEIDVLVNYRPDYNGEASAATIEAMRLGVVPIVRKIGWFDELPDEAVVKVESIDEVVPAIKSLYDNKRLLKEKSSYARSATKDCYNQQKYAKAIASIIMDGIKSNKSSINYKISRALRQKKSKKYIQNLLSDKNTGLII